MTLPSFQTAFSKSASDSAKLIYQGSKPSALTNFSSPSYTELIAPLWPQDEEGHMPEGIFPPTPPATPPTSEAVSNNPRGEEGGGGGGGHRQISGISHICQTCNKSYASRAKLNEHVNFRHSEARPHRCLQCPKVFKSASNLKAHFKRTHERLRFTCPDCPLGLDAKVFSESGLRYHRLSVHGGRPQFSCSICAKTFVQATLLRKHMASTHEVDRKFPCPYCPATFKRKDNADRHVTDTHSLVTELFECDVCGGRFQSASRLKQHAKLHHDESVRRPCHLCGKIMLARNLLVHLRRTHFDRKNVG